MLVAGIGGTGVVTIGQMLAMAAHVEGKGVTVLDMSGLAQKGGPVMSHVRIANKPEDLHAARIGTGDASLVIGCDLVVAASPDALAQDERTQDARGDQRHDRADRGFRAATRTGSFRAAICCTTSPKPAARATWTSLLQAAYPPA